MHWFCVKTQPQKVACSCMFHQTWNSGMNNPCNMTTSLNNDKSSTPENANDLYFAQSTPLPKRHHAYRPGPRWPLDHQLSTQRRRFLRLEEELLLLENSIGIDRFLKLNGKKEQNIGNNLCASWHRNYDEVWSSDAPWCCWGFFSL